MKSNTETLSEIIKHLHSSAAETLYYQLCDTELNGYDEDGDEEGNYPYENCSISITLTHKGETITL